MRLMFTPIQKKSVSDSVFEQLRDRIVQGDVEPGSPLPSERALSELLGVNRGAIREALKRLEQARLVAISQGGATRVLDFRETAGTDLIASLIVDGEGELNLSVARSVMEMRSAMGADIARLCAIRSPELAEELDGLVDQMQEKRQDLVQLQELNMNFWEVLVRGSQNVAYQLAFNSIRDIYSRLSELMAAVLVGELTDLDAHHAIAICVGNSDSDGAQKCARILNSKGETRVLELIEMMEG